MVFEVAMKSNKAEIKQAIEELFKVKVKAVNTSITKARENAFVVNWESRDINEHM